MTISQQQVQIDPKKEPETYLYAHQEGQLAPVGLTVLLLDEKENAGWVCRVFVNPEARRQGVARQLVERAIELTRAAGRQFVSLSVANDNEGAKDLYKSLGFVPFMTGQEGFEQYVKPL